MLHLGRFIHLKAETSEGIELKAKLYFRVSIKFTKDN